MGGLNVQFLCSGVGADLCYRGVGASREVSQRLAGAGRVFCRADVGIMDWSVSFGAARNLGTYAT